MIKKSQIFTIKKTGQICNVQILVKEIEARAYV